MSNEEKTTDVRKWGDEQQYEAAPMQANYNEKTGVLPKVTLLWMTPDPLGAIAAACRMYEGKPTYDLADITDDERRHYWDQAQATHLKAPLEYVQFHFFIEGVDRAFTHQMVRQRTAVFAQESMRFAVMGGGFLENTTLPPSLHGTPQSPDDWQPEDMLPNDERLRWRLQWDDAIRHVERAYTALVEGGMPAEEARGLLPHAMATRLNYDTNLRNLLDHSGNRLCTQAQFHWRLVFAQLAQAIRNFPRTGGASYEDSWQFEALASVFRPVCYELGKCPFQASFDRECSIRERVQTNAEHGRSSDQWHLPMYEETGTGLGRETRKVVDEILPQEWAMDPEAARRR